jgi:hypothetical protein
MKRDDVRSLWIAALMALATAAFAQSDLDALDANRDGTVDIEEAETKGRDVFRGLDTDMDGVLSAAEIAARLDAGTLAAYDSNANKSLDRNEYAKAIGIEFRNADANGNSRLDADELKSADGEKLLRLVR